jgi:hypothetical protein
MEVFRIEKERGRFSGGVIQSSVNGCWPCIGVLFVEQTALQTGYLGYFHCDKNHAGPTVAVVAFRIQKERGVEGSLAV